MSEARLAGKAALITGGARGIGRAVAIRFAREGARVAIAQPHVDEHAQEALALMRAASRQGGHQGDHGEVAHRAFAADVSKPGDCDRIVGETVAFFGRLDCLVANAGVQQETPGDAFDDATLERILAVNLLGAAWCARAALRHFETRAGGGSIVFTSSVHERIPKPGFLAYAMSKGGMGQMTRTLALEFASRGVRVNAVAPGAVVTDINAAWTNDAAKRAAVEAHIPMGRAAEPDEIAPLFAFLASDEASYVTGQTLYACGGLTLYGDFAKNWSS
ncbi:MAG: SDR family oxidoreductase [Rhizobiales bacterium]|nr:SDR family oxidoreductase [Hyphomicrobiales bacterium]